MRILSSKSSGLCQIVAVSLTFSGAALAKSSAAMTRSEQQLVEKMAQGNLAEIQLGSLAEKKASNKSVKEFAEQMVNDHTKLNDQLKEWASKNHAELPTSVSEEDRSLKDRLAKLKG